jgi:hypothetical protein
MPSAFSLSRTQTTATSLLVCCSKASPGPSFDVQMCHLRSSVLLRCSLQYEFQFDPTGGRPDAVSISRPPSSKKQSRRWSESMECALRLSASSPPQSFSIIAARAMWHSSCQALQKLSLPTSSITVCTRSRPENVPFTRNFRIHLKGGLIFSSRGRGEPLKH